MTRLSTFQKILPWLGCRSQAHFRKYYPFLNFLSFCIHDFWDIKHKWHFTKLCGEKKILCVILSKFCRHPSYTPFQTCGKQVRWRQLLNIPLFLNHFFICSQKILKCVQDQLHFKDKHLTWNNIAISGPY